MLTTRNKKKEKTTKNQNSIPYVSLQKYVTFIITLDL